MFGTRRMYLVFYALMLCILSPFRCVWKSVTIYLYILMHVKLTYQNHFERTGFNFQSASI